MKTLKRPYMHEHLPMPKRQRPLPNVLSPLIRDFHFAFPATKSIHQTACGAGFRFRVARKLGAMFLRVGYFATRSQVKIDSTTGEVSSGKSIRKDTRFGP